MIKKSLCTRCAILGTHKSLMWLFKNDTILLQKSFYVSMEPKSQRNKTITQKKVKQFY